MPIGTPTEGTIELNLSEPEWRDCELAPEQRATRGHAGAAPERNGLLRGWLKLGVPIVTKLNAPKSQLGFQFDHVLLAVSMRPDSEEPFVQVWLQIRLEGSPNGGETPIAWSLSPLQSFNAIEVTSKVKLDGSLKFGAGELGGGGEKESKTTEREIFLQGFNELRADPVWEFSATGSQQITGAHRLQLIVRRPVGDACRGSVELSATVQRKRWGIIPYRAAAASGDASTFELG